MKIPKQWHSQEDFNRRVANAINSNDDGNMAVNGEVTLTANAATTTLVNRRLGKDSVILFQPLTANAAAEMATMYVKVSDYDIANNQFTINHANNAQTDRDFRYIVIGQTLNAN